MVDSHVLVGSCAQIGARVHLAAGVTIGGVLEPPGARPVIVEDDAFVGAGSALLEGVLVESRCGHRCGRLPDRVVAGVRPRPRPSPSGHDRGAARGPGWSRGRPGRSGGRRRIRRRARPVRLGRAPGQGPRCGHLRAGRPRGGSPMSLELAEPPPRRGRPPARNEILRGGRLGRTRACRPRHSVRDAALRLRPRRGRAPARHARGRPAPARRARLRGQGEPGAGRRRPPRAPRDRRRCRLGRRAGDRPSGGHHGRSDRHDRPRQA